MKSESLDFYQLDPYKEKSFYMAFLCSNLYFSNDIYFHTMHILFKYK